MFNSSNASLFPSEFDRLDWEQPPVGVPLSSDHLQQAAQLCQSIAEPDQQWQAYLNALARFGVQEWLRDRAPDLTITPSPPATPVLEVGQFKLATLAMGNLTDRIVSLPTAMLDAPEQAAHFYVLVEVLEESDQVRPYGFFNYTQLAQYRQTAPPSIEPDGSYAVPLHWFDPNPNALLLSLRCLNPQTIPLPTISAAPAHPAALVPSLPSLTHIAFRIRNQLEAIVQDLSWQLLPPVTLATPAFRSSLSPNLRSAIDEVEAVVTELEASGVQFPVQSEGRYQDIAVADIPLRLYTIAGDVPSSANSPQWTLLVILAPRPGGSIANITLRIWDDVQLLVEQTTHNPTIDSDGSAFSYLCAQVIGTPRETFWVTIDANTEIFTLAFQSPSETP